MLKTHQNSPLDLLRVLLEAFLQLAGVGRHSELDVVGILLHHGLQLLVVLVHLLTGFGDVDVQLVSQQLKVLPQALLGLLGVRSHLGLQAVFVHGQVRHAVLDQGAADTDQDYGPDYSSSG